MRETVRVFVLTLPLIFCGCGPPDTSDTKPTLSGAQRDDQPVPNPYIPSQPTTSISNAQVAYQEAKKAVDAKWATCADRDGKTYLFSKVVPRDAPPNPFAPQLITPDEAKAFGYYQFSLPIKMEKEVITLTIADNQNGLREQYIFHWYTPSYRTWESQTGRWSEWQTGRA